MKKYETKVLVLRDGKIEIDAPVRKGETVEVTVRVIEPKPPTWPLRGLPVRYEDPYLTAVPPDEWDAGK